MGPQVQQWKESIILQWEILKVKRKIKSHVHSLTQNLKAEKGVKESKAFWIFLNQFDFMHSFVKFVSSSQLPMDTGCITVQILFSASAVLQRNIPVYTQKAIALTFWML